MKTCNKCGETKSLEDFFNARTKDGKSGHCKICNAANTRAWRKANPERQKELGRKSAKAGHDRAKFAVIDAYGGACNCCSENNIHFLTIEHKTKEAAERHRYPNGNRISGTKLLRLIAKEGFPDDITILCHNCNCSRGQYGGCPHEKDFEPRYEER